MGDEGIETVVEELEVAISHKGAAQVVSDIEAIEGGESVDGGFYAA